MKQCTFLVILLTLSSVPYGTPDACEVSIDLQQQLPSDSYSVIRNGSTVRVKCTVPINETIRWSVRLSVSMFHNTVMEVRRFGYLGITETMMENVNSTHNVGHLLINDNETHIPERLNGTIITCSGQVGPKTGTLVDITILVHDLKELSNLRVDASSLQSLNISWSLPQTPPLDPAYILVINSSTLNQSLKLNQTYTLFKSTAGAPPCEMYTFSVTAIYDQFGTTYTGAGCNVPTFVSNKMVPTAPRFNNIETTFNHSLTNNGNGNLSLVVHFKQAEFCESFPVDRYVLIVNDTQYPLVVQPPMLSEATVTVETPDEIPENVFLTFKVIAINTFGRAETNTVNIYTTDVQRVRVVSSERSSSIVTIECVFIINSTAQGCMVVLMGNGITTKRLNLTRDYVNNNVMEFVLPQSLSCYTHVFAFDIESDDLVGTLAVPGEVLLRNQDESCMSTGGKSSTTTVGTVIGVVSGILLIILMTLLVLFIAIIYIRLKKRRSLKEYSVDISNVPSSVDKYTDQREENVTDIICMQTLMPVYDLPEKKAVKTKIDDITMTTEGDTTDHHYHTTLHKKMEIFDASNNNNYAELNEEEEGHHYFVLEDHRTRSQKGSEDIAPDPDAPALPPPFKPDPPPVYHDINGMPYMEEESAENEYATVKK